MRKVLFVCAAVALVAGAGAYLLVDQAMRHPQSMVGQWTTAFAEVGARINPFVAVSRITPEVPSGPVACQVPPGQGQMACLRQVNKPIRHLAEAQVDVAEEPMEVIRVEDVPQANDFAPVFDRNPEITPEPCEDQEADGENVFQETGEPGPAGVEESEPADVGGDADQANVRMPYADEDEVDADAEDKALMGHSCNWLWQILKKMTQGCGEGAQGECLPAPNADQPDTPGEGPEASSVNDLTDEASDEDFGLEIGLETPAGTLPAGTLLPDLNIPINESNFDLTPPDFDHYPGPSTEPTDDPANEGTQGSTDSQPEQSHTYSDYHHGQDLSCPYPHSCMPPAYSLPAEEKQAEIQEPVEQADIQESVQPATKPVKKVKKFLLKMAPVFKPIDLVPLYDSSDAVGNPTKLDTMEYRPSDGDEDAYRDLRF
jgi:hypothetical protein